MKVRELLGKRIEAVRVLVQSGQVTTNAGVVIQRVQVEGEGGEECRTLVSDPTLLYVNVRKGKVRGVWTEGEGASA